MGSFYACSKRQGLKCIWLLPLAKLKVCKPEKDGGPMVDLSLQVILSTQPYPENTIFYKFLFLKI